MLSRTSFDCKQNYRVLLDICDWQRARVTMMTSTHEIRKLRTRDTSAICLVNITFHNDTLFLPHFIAQSWSSSIFTWNGFLPYCRRYEAVNTSTFRSSTIQTLVLHLRSSYPTPACQTRKASRICSFLTRTLTMRIVLVLEDCLLRWNDYDKVVEQQDACQSIV
jgi:hypothetical protein